MAATTVAELEPVAQVKARLQALLDLARTVQSNDSVDHPLPTSELAPEVDALHAGLAETYDQNYRFAIVEAAARDIFYSYISDTDINDPAFTTVWNLFDILLLCGDRGQCAPELVCWLIEELLDSLTTSGCRTVFNYLESRRSRLAAKDFHKKNLVFLRSCNELLRRLSRAEDSIFCGRVFFFLFQTFPLGDKSSVNLRGEFHTENLTVFEVPPAEAAKDEDQMEVDAKLQETSTAKDATPSKSGARTPAKGRKSEPKAVEEEVLSQSELYPIFWRLQQDFSDPTRLFAPDNFEVFKKSLASTIAKFKKTHTVQTKIRAGNQRGTKRKLGDDDGDANSEPKDHFSDNYNPKYLTSQDLFDLELSDQAFQRHILVQALILIDFLLSLTEKAKRNMTAVDAQPNKSMLYSFTLSEDDTKWAVATRSTIAAYLTLTQDGKLYYRMVDTVLARDRNWARWKVESCPSIVRDPVSTEQELEARRGARAAVQPRRVPARPNNGLDFSQFLDEGCAGGLAALEDPKRYTPATIEELIGEIETDELDLDFAEGEEKVGLENAMSNKRWRALRQARATQLTALEKVAPGKSLKDVFMPRVGEAVGEEGKEVKDDEGNGEEGGEADPEDQAQGTDEPVAEEKEAERQTVPIRDGEAMVE